MARFNLRNTRFSYGVLLITAVSIVAMTLLLAQYRWQARELLKQHQKQFIVEYGTLFIQSVRRATKDGEFVPADIGLLTHIEELAKVCLYREQLLLASLVKNSATQCRDSLESAVEEPSTFSRSYFPFQDGQNKRNLLLIDYRNPISPPYYLDLVGGLLLILLGFAIWLGSQGYFKRLQKRFNIPDISELETLCADIVHNRFFKNRAAKDLHPPFKQLAEAINYMLDEIQENEINLQENAVQLQEKNDQLASQKKLHIDRTQNLQKMFAGASHDLRQPLQAMTIFISAIKENANPEQLPLIQKLEQILDNLNELFTDLLDISKLESRMQRIPKSIVEVKPLLNKIFDEFEALANEKNIQLRLYQRDLSVYSNPNMLERIIRNMISNAIRYTRSGGVLIGSRLRKDEIWIEVWDTGRGIPPDKMTEIFNEFVQIKDEDQQPNKGVGLGLFIVKKLAQLLDHSIVVKSKMRKGTLFRIIVPVDTEAKPISAPATSVAKPMELPTNIGHTHFEHPTIILIDDDEDIRSGVVSLIHMWNLKVIDFASIEHAKDYLMETKEDVGLIISDYQLGPVDTGLQAIDVLRGHLKNETPAIIISGTDDPKLIRKIQDSQLPYLKKPIKPAKLRAIINVLMDHKKT